MKKSASIGSVFLLAVLFFSVSLTSGAQAGPTDAQKAQADYMLHCAPCHGDRGDGKGQLAEALGIAPRNHTDSKYMSTRTDEQLIKVVTDGGAASGFDEGMPPFSTILSNGEIKGVVAYVRQLCNCKYTKE
jgi:mono/diheme cytochrome c family protein